MRFTIDASVHLNALNPMKKAPLRADA